MSYNHLKKAKKKKSLKGLTFCICFSKHYSKSYFSLSSFKVWLIVIQFFHNKDQEPRLFRTLLPSI